MTKDEALKLALVALEWYVETDDVQECMDGNEFWVQGKRDAEKAITAINNALAQPVQEPVAWITPDGEGFRIRFSAPTSDVSLGWDALYTAPTKRPWVGLTDEEVREICVNEWGINEWGGYEQCRATEAKLKEKNT